MISEPVQSFRRTFEALMPFDVVWAAGSKVLNECPASNGVFSSNQSSVKILRAEKVTNHSLHEAIDHVTGSESTGKIIID